MHATNDYAVVDVPGCGYGMRAQRDLEPGTVILRETPLAVLTGAAFTEALHTDPVLRSLAREADERTAESTCDDERRAPDEKLIQHFAECEFSKLSEEKKRRWLSLADSWSRPPAKSAGNVVRSNGFTDAASGDTHLYELLSRANHSCAPNMGRVFEGRWHVATLRVLQPVARHEDLLISYLSEAELAKPTSERRALLSSRFNFICECTRCGPATAVATAPARHALLAARHDAPTAETNLPASRASSSSEAMEVGGPLGVSESALGALNAAQRAFNGQLYACAAQLDQMTSPLDPAAASVLESVRRCAEALAATESARRCSSSIP